MATTTSRKVIIITGGASGIGLAVTKHLASQGHIIKIFDVNESEGPRIAAQLAVEYPEATFSFEHCNVSTWDSLSTAFERVFSECGRIDIVMANAGISERGRSDMAVIDEQSPTQPRTSVVDVNLVGVMYTVKLAAHYMNKKNDAVDASRGTIICTASGAGLYPFPIAPVYAATKSGVIALVRSLARPYAAANIQINALAPAVLDTNIAPDKALYKDMIVTPFSTLIRGVQQFIDRSDLTGTVAEIHGESVTIRPPLDFVDQNSAKNYETFWKLGYA